VERTEEKTAETQRRRKRPETRTRTTGKRRTTEDTEGTELNDGGGETVYENPYQALRELAPALAEVTFGAGVVSGGRCQLKGGGLP
jgi:hypothetical protein